MYEFIRYNSPLGVLTVTAKDGAITALVIDGQKYANRHLAHEMRENETPVLAKARNWLDRYFAGQRPDISELSLAPEGTNYQKRIWKALLDIPYGKTVSYGTLAEIVGGSARATGGAVGRNPISVIVPCHRVLGANGSLTGYAGGIENKKKLLRLEGAIE